MDIGTSIKSVINDIDEGMALISPVFVILGSNRAFARMVGLSPDRVIGMNCHKALQSLDEPCFKKGLYCPVKDAIQSNMSSSVAITSNDTIGSQRMLFIKAYPVRDTEDGPIRAALIIATDNAEKAKLESQLLHSQKMQSIGTLAGGIAHYFKNVLTAITTFSELMSSDRTLAPDTVKYARIIERSAQKATDAITQLLDFSRIEDIEGEPVDINVLIEDTLGMVENLIPKSIEVRLALTTSLPPAAGSVNQMEQAIMNLIINASDAMPGGGMLSISTSMAHITERPAKPHSYINPGRYATVTISDTGVGIDPKSLERVFEPFFTTKPPGEGTGLGLSMTYRIIKRHRGYITLSSSIGKGTTFSVYLPLTAPPD